MNNIKNKILHIKIIFKKYSKHKTFIFSNIFWIVFHYKTQIYHEIILKNYLNDNRKNCLNFALPPAHSEVRKTFW